MKPGACSNMSWSRSCSLRHADIWSSMESSIQQRRAAVTAACLVHRLHTRHTGLLQLVVDLSNEPVEARLLGRFGAGDEDVLRV